MLQFSLFRRITIFAICLAGLFFAAPNAFYNRVEQSNDARALIELGDESDTTQAIAASWPSFLPRALVNLGLDLRGGAHLLAEVQVEQVYSSQLDALWPAVRDSLREARDQVGTIRRIDSPDDQLRVRISRPESIPRAVELVQALGQPVQTIGAVGESNLDVSSQGDVIIVTLSAAEMAAQDNRTMQQSLEIIRRRVDEAGTREPSIQRQGDDRILIQVPGIGSAEELKNIIGKTAKLEFYTVVQTTGDPNATVRSRQIVLPDAENSSLYYVLEKPPC